MADTEHSIELARRNLFASFKREKLKLCGEMANLNFLKLRKFYEVTPKFLNIRNKTIYKQFRNRVNKFQLMLLRDSIRQKHKSIAIIKNKLETLTAKANNLIPENLFFDWIMRINIYVNIRERTRERIHLKKLSNLLRKKEKSCDDTPNPIDFAYINNSNKKLSDKEDCILKLGPKYVFPDRPNFKTLIPEFETILKGIDYPLCGDIRKKLVTTTSVFMNKKIPYGRTELDTIKGLKDDPTTAIILTDKSNKIAILNRNDYDKKLIETIKEMKCIIINKDPNGTLIDKVKEIISTGSWPGGVKVPFIPVNPITPLIYGRLKDHKDNNPLRPIVSKCRSPTFILEKTLAIILKKFLPTSTRALSSTQEFVTIMKEVGIGKHEIMASMDVISLYPSLNMQKAEETIFKALDCVQDLTQDNRLTIKRSLSLIIRSNFFRHKDVFYQQTEGAPMGSPISGVVAEFILRPLEDTIHNMEIKPKIWLRYVDDVFLIWDKRNNLDTFVNLVNNIDKDIKFTVEVENKGNLNFLDLSLNRHKNGRIHRGIYRKSMASSAVIPNNAEAPTRYKLSAFNFMINRALKFCDKVQMKEEFDKIKEIATNNGFDPSVVDKVKKKILAKNQRNVKTEDLKFGGSINYHEGLTEKVVNVFKNYGINIAIKMKNKMNQIVRSDKDRLSNDMKNGVYRLPYWDEVGNERVYIGMTKRQLAKRREEHRKNIMNKEGGTVLAQINKKSNITVDFDGMKIIAPYTSNRGTLIRETIEIELEKDACNTAGTVSLPQAWKPLFHKLCNPRDPSNS